MRAGALGLSLLSDPLDVKALEVMANGPSTLIDLRRALGAPPETTLRKHLRTLMHYDLIKRWHQREFPTAVYYEMTESGQDLVCASRVLKVWLAASPNGSLAVGSPLAKSAGKALIDGWTTNIMRALAARPLSLTELNRVITAVNYPSLERRLSAMRLAGQVTPVPSHGAAKPYRVTNWLRKAVGPILASAQWERRRTPRGHVALGRLEVESTFLLATPLIRPSSELEGVVSLAVELSSNTGTVAAGVVVEVNGGLAVSCKSDLRADSQNSISGTDKAWLSTLLDADASGLEFRGDPNLCDSLIESLREAVLYPCDITAISDERTDPEPVHDRLGGP
jgi:DNA-binding HxlR family transcriptional regulator